METHEKLLLLIEEHINQNKSFTEIKKAWYSLIRTNLPTGEFMMTKDLGQLFDISPYHLKKVLEKTPNIRIIPGPYPSNLFYVSDLKRLYFSYASNIPLIVLSRFVVKRGLVDRVGTFYGRFNGTYTSEYKSFKLVQNFLGEKSITLASLYAILLKLRTDNYVKNNWHRIEDLALVKNVAHHTVCDWIESHQIKKIYKVGKRMFISPEDYEYISSSKSTVELGNFLGINPNAIRAVKGKISWQNDRPDRLRFSQMEIQELQERIGANEIFFLAKKKRLREKTKTILEFERERYEAEFDRLKSHDFLSLPKEEQEIIIFAAKLRIKNSMEFLLKSFDSKIKSIAKHWHYASTRKVSSVEELHHLGTIGLLKAVERYTSYNVIVPYIHANITWEIKAHLFPLWKERYTFRKDLPTDFESFLERYD